MGNQVETIILENQPSGKQEYVWNASGLPDGMYFVYVKTEQLVAKRKIVKLE